MIKSVKLPAEPRVMPPVPVLFELVMVVPPIVSVVPLLKFRTSVLPIVRLLIAPFTSNCTVEDAVVIKALLPEFGTVANEHDDVVLQLPGPPVQLSEVIGGRAKGWKPK